MSNEANKNMEEKKPNIQEGQPHAVEMNRLKFFPIMMYAIVMGISGLTIAYEKAVEFLGFSHVIANVMMYVSLGLFAIISIIYLIKLLKYPKAVANEWKHPVRINFFSAISISMLMLAIITTKSFPTLHKIFWYGGTIMHFYMTLYTLSFWISKNQEINHSNPAWFIPIVGNVLVPVAGADIASSMVLIYFFSVGLFFWIIMLAIILNRIIFHHQMAQKFMPTLFILIAPPAVAFIAYFKLFHHIDTFAQILYTLAIFFTFLVAFMFKQFLGLKYFISWWAFIFPLAAMSIAAMIVSHKAHDIFSYYFAYIMIGITSLMTLIVLYQTIVHMFKKEICIQE
jgi:tellurite resistance protein